MSGAMANRAGCPGIGTPDGLAQQVKHPFNVRVEQTAWNPMPLQRTEEFGHACRGLGRLCNRRVDQNHLNRMSKKDGFRKGYLPTMMPFRSKSRPRLDDRALPAPAYGTIDLLLQSAVVPLAKNPINIGFESLAALRTKRFHFIIVSIGKFGVHP
jgi:hypothetical protein